MLAFGNIVTAYARGNDSIVIAVGQEVPTDDGQPQGYGFPSGYQENAVQFVTDDGVALCGYVLGTGSRGITLAHARGWGLKSWLPFGERLAKAGYQVILWEFRDTAPSGSSADGMGQRWDLDVLAAAQVLRERGVTEIIAMGASYGGTATVVAAAEIPELAGVVILSAPAYDMEIDAISAIESVTAPAFFAVSKEDWQNVPGVYQAHVESLYEACGSDRKEIHIIEGLDHGTDMITVPPEGELGYAVLPRTQEQRKARENLADELMRFVNETFGQEPTADVPEESKKDEVSGISGQIDDQGDVPQPAIASEADRDDEGQSGALSSNPWVIVGGTGVLALLIFLTAIIRRRHLADH